MANPRRAFVYGRVVDPDEFVGRKGEASRVEDLVRARQSVLVTGPVHIGKSSLLRLLEARARQDASWESWIVCDMQAMYGISSAEEFWLTALPEVRSESADLSFALRVESAIKRLWEQGRRRVLVIDEFESLLAHPQLKTPAFLGLLRSVASRLDGIVIIGAAHADLSQLELAAQLHVPGSPYLNVFTQVSLGALSESESIALLGEEQGELGADERRFVLGAAGRHPYMLQLGGAAICIAADAGLRGKAKLVQAALRIREHSRLHFDATWRSWPSEKRVAAVVATLTVGSTCPEGDAPKLAWLVESLGGAFESLESEGAVARTGSGTWKIVQEAFAWWLLTRVDRATTDHASVLDWLQMEGLDSRLARGGLRWLDGTPPAKGRRADERLHSWIAESFTDEKVAWEFDAEIGRRALGEALVDMGVVDAPERVPRAWAEASGVAERSRVWFVSLSEPPVNVVAKFDSPERAAREWDTIEALQRLNAPLHAILPVAGNRRSHGVVILQDVAAHSSTGSVWTLKVLLEKQLGMNVENCRLALDRLMDTLRVLYMREPGTISLRSADGRVERWQAAFPTLEAMRVELVECAGKITPGVDWSRAAAFQLAKGRPLPNPFADLERRLRAPIGRVARSRIHGDLNLTNALVGLDGACQTESVFLIDLANSQADAVTSVDLARMESEVWLEVVAPQSSLESVIAMRDWLDGRSDECSDHCPMVGGAGKFVAHLRRWTQTSVGGGQAGYCLVDYMTALYLSFMRALSFASIRNSRQKFAVAVVSAAMSVQYLREVESGAYESAEEGRPIRRRPRPKRAEG